MSTDKGSSSSTSSSGPRGKGRVYGIPKRCWCGSSILGLISKSEANPCRRYFHCEFAVKQKLMNDDHTFKCVDEALLNEIEALQFRNEKLEKELVEVKAEREEFVKKVFDEVKLQVEKKILEKETAGLVESSGSMKKTMILVMIGCMVMFGIGKLHG